MKADMPNSLISVQEAISRGERMIASRAKWIIISSIVLGLLLPLTFISGIALLLIPVGLVLSLIYTSYITPKWRVWAYEHVADIHQFQRSAELAGLLTIGSHESAVGLMGGSRRRKLRKLQERFKDEAVFVDDSFFPAKAFVGPGVHFADVTDPALVLSDSGITVEGEGFFEWDKIADERIARVSYSRMSPRTGLDNPAGSNDFFRFEYQGRRIEIPMSTLNITKWKLDLLLYIYRGRYGVKVEPGLEDAKTVH